MKGSKVRILDYMKRVGSITSRDAFREFGITRLSARIFDLRNLGYKIDTITIESINRYGETVRYAKYVLKGEPDDENIKGVE